MNLIDVLVLFIDKQAKLEDVLTDLLKDEKKDENELDIFLAFLGTKLRQLPEKDSKKFQRKFIREVEDRLEILENDGD